MNPIARNILAVIVGFVIGSVVNLGLVNIGMSVVPLPEGADVSTMEGLRESMRLFTPANFIFPFLAHALGTLTGAFAAAKLAASHHMKFAIGIGVSFPDRRYYDCLHVRWSRVVHRIRPITGVHSNGISWRPPCPREETSNCITFIAADVDWPSALVMKSMSTAANPRG